MIKAIIFDCFGVLATDGWLPFKEDHFGHSKDLYAKATDLNKQADAGLLDYKDYMRKVADLAGITEAEVASQLEANVPNRPLFSYIQQELNPKYKLGMLSNSGGNWLGRLFSEDQIELFDAVVLSYEIGVVKPDPKMYQAIAQKLGVELNECVFVDDQERYCAGAENLGMRAVYYQNFKQAKFDLSSLLM